MLLSCLIKTSRKATFLSKICIARLSKPESRKQCFVFIIADFNSECSEISINLCTISCQLEQKSKVKRSCKPLSNQFKWRIKACYWLGMFRGIWDRNISLKLLQVNQYDTILIYWHDWYIIKLYGSFGALNANRKLSELTYLPNAFLVAKLKLACFTNKFRWVLIVLSRSPGSAKSSFLGKF